MMCAVAIALVAGVAVPPESPYPKSWGEPPMMGTMDYRALPGGYGHGSSTLASWISDKMESERKSANGQVSFPPAFGEPPMIQTMDYRPLPFGYGHGSGTIAQWLTTKAQEVYGETVEEYDAMNTRRKLQDAPYPKSWGEPPMMGTMDYRALPGGYGHGSSTLASWISDKMESERKSANGQVSFPPAFGEPPRMQTRDFRPLPFGYGHGSGTIAQWLTTKAQEVYGETVEEYDAMYASTNDRRKLQVESPYPKSWGEPPMIQTMDYRALPGGYGHGSSTLASWISDKMESERKSANGQVSFPPAFGEPPRMQTRDFRPLPFGYGHGSGTIAQWLTTKAQEVYGETVEEYDAMYASTVEGQ